MSGGRQFDRYYELVIDDLLIKNLRVSFTATRLIDQTPNTLELNIYGLNPEHQAQLQKAKKPIVQLSAGYKDHHGVLFLGEARSIFSEKETTDWVTSISSADGEDEQEKSRVSKSFAAGTSYETVILEIAESMGGIGLGNMRKALKKGKLPNGGKSFPKGVTVHGQSKKELNRLLLSAGLQWSIQGRQFQVLEANKSLQDIAYVISPSTGLIGSPIIDNQGELKFRALMNAEIVPGRQVEVKSRYVSGFFRCERCEYSGDIAGKPWYVNVESKEIST